MANHGKYISGLYINVNEVTKKIVISPHIKRKKKKVHVGYSVQEGGDFLGNCEEGGKPKTSPAKAKASYKTNKIIYNKIHNKKWPLNYWDPNYKVF